MQSTPEPAKRPARFRSTLGGVPKSLKEIEMNVRPGSLAVRVVRARVAIFAVLIGSLPLGGCETQQQRITAHEDKLSAAGFIIRPANTAQRQAMLKQLPPNGLLRRENGDDVHYVYADAIVCGCLYVGTQQAYNQFKANEVAQRLVDEQQLTAETYADSTWNWGAWGPWGPGLVTGPSDGSRHRSWYNNGLRFRWAGVP
jgi:hypothetical protein